MDLVFSRPQAYLKLQIFDANGVFLFLQTEKKIFLVNESEQGAYFDELEIVVSQKATAKIVQENHYYPFGLNMVGIEKVGKPDDKFQYNKKEKEESLELLWNDHGARHLDLQLCRWNGVDALASKYLAFSPYVSMGNNPISFVDLDGREPSDRGKGGKVIIVAFRGGPDGGGKIGLPQNEGTTGQVIINAENYAKEQGVQVKSLLVQSGATATSSIENALYFISENYQKGDKLVLYGYSYGGDFAVELAHSLKEKEIQIDLLLTVDASDGPLKNTTVNDKIPENVKEAMNWYQQEESGNSYSSWSSRKGSNSESSHSPTSMFPSSRGDSKYASDSKKTRISNYNMSFLNKPSVNTGWSLNHGNIDEFVLPQVNKVIKSILKNEH